MLSFLTAMSLRWQSVLAIAVILLGELVFVGLLAFQLNEAQNEVAKEAHVKEILKKSQKLVYLLNDYEHGLEQWTLNRDPELLQKADRNQEEMKQIMNWLRKNAEDDAKMRQQIEGLALLQGKMFKLIDKVRAHVLTMEQSELMSYVQGFYAKIRDYRFQWEHSAVNLIGDQEKALQTYPELHIQRRRVLVNIVWIGLFGNALMVCIYSLFFFRSVASRLNLMVDNTRRLAKNAQLNPRLSGADEISKLDGAMHDMAEAIENAQRERQAFLAMVSHELRTPLTSVKGTLDLLSMGVAGELEASSLAVISASDDELKRLLQLINDLLDLEKLEAGRLVFAPKTVYLERLLEEALDGVQALAHNKNVAVEVPETLVELNVDADRVRQSIQNVLENAITASAVGATVQIEVQEFDGKDVNAEVEVRILDRGPGVPPAAVERLFERFRSATADGDGLMKGMGLPIARHIIEGHGGRISYEMREGGGSIFLIRLPMLSL